FNATLTLPGIAGFILTIGAAVDANVLINERIREEIRRGRRLIDAVETGYHEAFRAIFDANVTHVISAGIMAYFGSGPVRGFAVYRGLNLGVDFVGGQLIRVSFPQAVDDEQLRSKVDSLHLGEANVQRFGGPKSFQIRLPKPPGGDAAANNVATQVKAEIEK